jgi:hypothetical protein
MAKTDTEFVCIIAQFLKKGCGAEIGVLRGEHAEMILNKYNGKVYLIDPWEKQEQWNSKINDYDFESIYDIAVKRMQKYKDRVEFLRMTSEEASKKIPDGHLDWVFIDGRHSYEAAKQDINLWYKKIRSGGLVSGHDYYNAKRGDIQPNGIHTYVEDFGVKQAVDEFANEHNYTVNTTKARGINWWFIKR